MKNPTFFTHDAGYFKRSRVHRAYGLVWLDLYDGDAAVYILRFLRHPAFRTHSQRMGKVVRVHVGGLDYWEAGVTQRAHVNG